MWETKMDKISEQQCYRKSPYGKRFAVQHLGVAKEDLPMPEFTLEDESALHRYVNSKREKAESQGVMFNFEIEGKAEMCWFEAWHHGIRLLPEPVVPVGNVEIADDNLLNNNVYYLKFSV